MPLSKEAIEQIVSNIRIKIFTHTDLDGIGAYIVLKHAFGVHKADIDVEFVDYNNVDQAVNTFFEDGEYENYDMIFITDISPNEKVAENINYIIKEKDIRIHLLDHHPTALELNQYHWAKVETLLPNQVMNDKKTCGTRLVYDYVTKLGLIEDLNILSTFVEDVRKYDVWEWEAENYEPSYDLDLLLSILGREAFIEFAMSTLENTWYEDKFTITRMEQYLVDVEKTRIDRMINKLEKTMKSIQIGANHFGYVFASTYKSNIGSVLSQRYPELAGVIIINPRPEGGSISWRNKSDFDLGAFIKERYNCDNRRAGGHPAAAGMGIMSIDTHSYITNIFGYNNDEKPTRLYDTTGTMYQPADRKAKELICKRIIDQVQQPFIKAHAEEVYYNE